MESSFREFEPHPALVPFVDRFWVRSGAPDTDRGPRRILPDGCIDLVVDAKHGWNAVIVGTMTRAVLFEPSEPAQIVAVRFRPGAAGAFLNVAADEITDRVVDAHDLGVRWLEPMRCSDETSLTAGVRALERVLLDRLSSTNGPNASIAFAVSKLFASDPPSVEALARDIGWSRQHLGRAMKFHVGVSPVQFARVARLQRSVDRLQRDPRARLADAALRCGYFDQAHMTRDFRELAGVTPREIVDAEGSIFPIRSLLEAHDLRR